MKRFRAYLDAFIVGGFLTNVFNGFLNPLYISMILSQLDSRVIAMGSVIASGFPVMLGLMMEKQSLFKRLYKTLPIMMVAEIGIAAAAIAAAAVDLAAYYLLTMVIFGVFSTSVVYLLQKLKENRYRRGRAAFDRRCAVADGIGYLAGSGLSLLGIARTENTILIAAAGVLQTAVVYGVFLFVYRKIVPRRKPKSAAEQEPHPRWLEMIAA